VLQGNGSGTAAGDAHAFERAVALAKVDVLAVGSQPMRGVSIGHDPWLAAGLGEGQDTAAGDAAQPVNVAAAGDDVGGLDLVDRQGFDLPLRGAIRRAAGGAKT